MARPAKELEKLSLKLREDAFITFENCYMWTNQIVDIVAKERNIELSYAELEVIAEHLREDLGEIGAHFDDFNFEREVDEDYAEDYEDEDEDEDEEEDEEED